MSRCELCGFESRLLTDGRCRSHNACMKRLRSGKFLQYRVRLELKTDIDSRIDADTRQAIANVNESARIAREVRNTYYRHGLCVDCGVRRHGPGWPRCEACHHRRQWTAEPTGRRGEPLRSLPPADNFMAETVPAGRYAIDTQAGAVNEVAFYHVDRADRWVVVRLILGPQEQQLNRERGHTIITKIAETGPREAMIRYGREIGECGRCSTRLTNDESRAYGIGPDCRRHLGW